MDVSLSHKLPHLIRRATAAIALVFSPWAFTESQMALENHHIEAGKYLVGETAQADFNISNSGDSDLTIIEKGKSCDCTSVLTDNVVPPGESTMITVSVDIDHLGSRTVFVNFETNDPQNPLLTLHMEFEAVRSIQYNVNADRTVSRQSGQTIILVQVEVFSLRGKKDFSIDKIVLDKSVRFAGTTPTFPVPSRSRHVLNLALDPSVASSRDAYVVLRTNDSEQPIVEIPLRIPEQVLQVANGDQTGSPSQSRKGSVKNPVEHAR